MDPLVLQKHLLKLIELHAPIKARNLAKILSDEFGKHVDRSAVNSALYSLKAERKVEANSSYEWSLYGKATASNSGSTRKSAEPEVEVKPVAPEITFTPEQQAVIDLDPADHLLIRG